MKDIIFSSSILYGVVTILAIGLIQVGCSSTPPFTDASGNPIDGSIASLEKIDLGGRKQTILIRGRSVNHPVLLFLHGGPGTPEMALLRHFNSELENHFVVVIWEQRGAGKSYSPFINDEEMSIDQFLSDTHELVEIIRHRFGKKKIYLAGHSWGSYLGLATIHQYPELFYAYIGIGQVVHAIEGERISLAYTLEQAKISMREDALKELQSIQSYPIIGENWFKELRIQRKWLGKFGGILHGKEDMESLFFIERPSEFTLLDYVRFGLGSYFSLRHVWPEFLRTEDFRKTAQKLKVPVFFVTGRYDYNVPFELVEDYYRRLEAPKKELIWFESSAHMPNVEEPEKFQDLLINKVLPETFGP